MSVRLIARFALSVIVDVPSEPLVPPLPICSVPWVIVVAPEKLLLAVRIVVPVPSCVSAPAPDSAPARVVEPEVSMMSVPSSKTAPAPSDPPAPPVPT